MARHAELIATLEALPGVTLRVDERVARHSALRIGGEVEAWVLVHDEAGVKAVLSALRKAKLELREHQPLGDHYAREEGLSGAMLRLGPSFGLISIEDETIQVGAAAPLAQLGVMAQRAGLRCWAPLRRWPGTLGGWVKTADAEALAPLVVSVRAAVGRGIVNRSGTALAGLGRKAVILGATLVRCPDAPLPPPPSCPGSLFVLDASLRLAMAQSRLPGLRLRSIRLAGEQAGVVVNLGSGGSRDLDLVIRLVKDRLKRDHGLEVVFRLQPMGRPPKNAPVERLSFP